MEIRRILFDDQVDACAKNASPKVFKSPNQHPAKTHNFSSNATILPPFSSPSSRNPASYIYPTRSPRRGLCIVVSIDKYSETLSLPPRNGSSVDVRNLVKAFKYLDFEVKVYSNLTVCALLSLIRTVASENHTDCDTLAWIVLTHGDEGNILYAVDGPISLDQLVLPFRGDSCPTLRGKPKLFFIQACRGSALDDGVWVCDGPQRSTQNSETFLRRIPVEADLLIAHAVQPGYYAFRNSALGSWFISALCDVLLRYGHSMDLLSMLTRVNYSVAYDFESVAANPEFSGKKQVPSIVSTLTKDVRFPPKTVHSTCERTRLSTL